MTYDDDVVCFFYWRRMVSNAIKERARSGVKLRLNEKIMIRVELTLRTMKIINRKKNCTMWRYHRNATAMMSVLVNGRVMDTIIEPRKGLLSPSNTSIVFFFYRLLTKWNDTKKKT
jgi:hypothetical protein